MNPTTADALARLCPSLDESWQAFVASDAFHADEPYNTMTALARQIASAHLRDPDADFSALFAEVERQVASGSPAHRNLLIVGLMEDLQGALLHQDLPLTTFDPLLGPSSKIAWQALIDMWQSVITPAEFNRIVDQT
ncbi:MAG: hypothetical protein QOF11_2692 [Chloroflexota bacterium]|jgi:hypothetical protein|nr:hypothetical protein [Chloroflexota bacterium]